MSNDDGALFPDIALHRINAHRPVICCSDDAARSFLDTLEVVFRDMGDDEDDEDDARGGRGRERGSRGRSRRTHDRITVYERVDEYDDDGTSSDARRSPIRITFHVAHGGREYGKRHDDIRNAMEDVTLTLLPCHVNDDTNALDIVHVLRQLRRQLDIESLLVEGGSGVLSSFLNACPNDARGANGTTATDGGNGNGVVDCVCATISPRMMGGHRGLPVLGGYRGGTSLSRNGAGLGPANVEDETRAIDGGGAMLSFRDSDFIKLGRDGIFLGRI